MARPALSVIVPALNEAGALGRLAQQLRQQQGVALQMILADGGSADATPALARRLGFAVVQSEAGRGRQMNQGAAAARGAHLLFLHADSTLTGTRLLERALACLKQAEAEAASKAPPVAGHFALDFQTQDPRLKARLAYFERKSQLNRPGTWNGDQGLLIARRAFHALGGFSEALPFLEDQDFGERLGKAGRFITLPGRLGTSARRFETEGFARRSALNALILGMRHLRLGRFFQQAPAVYRQQGEAGALRLAPFFALAGAALFSDGPAAALRRLYALGRYVCGNAWQLCFYLGGEKRLAAYDRYARPLLANPLGYALAALLALGWFGGAWALAWLQDAPRDRRLSKG